MPKNDILQRNFLKRCNILEKMLFLKLEPIPIEKTDPN